MNREKLIVVSVIVPLYKGEKYIESICTQCKKNALALKEDQGIELIFVCDFPEEIDLYREKISIFADNQEWKLLTHDHNMGIHYSRIQGLEAARGKYILFLDQDDHISDNCLADQLAHICDAAMVVGNGIYEQGDGSQFFYRWKILHETVKWKWCYLTIGNRITSPGQCLIRKDAIPTIWKETVMKVNGADDLFLWLILLEQKAKIVLNRNAVYIHRYTGENVSLEDSAMNESVLEFIGIARENGCIRNSILNALEKRVTTYSDSGIISMVVRLGKLVNRRK
ncbi:MAG: glycosyltransferase family 2 protein [Lachnospiraceae bacterium]|nr:glycosyltransferase family 2 protein [Lachnospiraceae bacterium]